MPIFAHAFAGVGIGAATVRDARSARLRARWIGVAALLAYLPDVSEWTARTLGWDTLAPSAIHSIPVMLAMCLLYLVLCRWYWRERGWVAPIAGVAAIASHVLLDWADGGLALWWPISPRTSGPDWFHLHGLSGRERLVREVLLFGWMAAVGVSVLLFREWRARSTSLLNGHPFKFLVGQAIWAWPLFVLAGVHAYIDFQGRRADEHWKRDEWADAIPWFERSARLNTVDGVSAATLFKLGYCYHMTGNDAAAEKSYLEGIRLRPQYPTLYCGLAELYLESRDPRFFRPEKVPAITEILRSTATRDYQFRDADRFLARAQRALATMPSVEPVKPPMAAR